jgi:hypothetical protein
VCSVRPAIRGNSDPAGASVAVHVMRAHFTCWTRLFLQTHMDL